MSEPVNASAPGTAPLQEQILQDRPRMGPDDTFRFGCHPGVSCFNHCCSDVNIFLSPYDVLRMRKRLGMGSGEFLEKHVILPVQKDMRDLRGPTVAVPHVPGGAGRVERHAGRLAG